ncbi:hypothetical protein GC174_04630 [bacterium]|nr:hypothetical protein [bacterium]
MALVLIGFLAIFMTGTQSTKEPPLSGKNHNKEAESQVHGQFAQEPLKASDNNSQKASKAGDNQEKAAVPGGLKPADAEEFVKWWIGGAMDFQLQTAEGNRQKAMEWMTPEAAEIFKHSFWNSDIKNGITSGNIVAAFHPVSVSATALNPDGSVVVHVKGSLVMQRAGEAYPNTEHLLTDYLVVKESEGFRIAGVHSKTYEQASAPSSYY